MNKTYTLITITTVTIYLISGCINPTNQPDNKSSDIKTTPTIIKTDINEYYDCPSDLKSGSLSPEAYRKMGKIPPQCKKETVTLTPTNTPTPEVIIKIRDYKDDISNRIDKPGDFEKKAQTSGVKMSEIIQQTSKSYIVDKSLKYVGAREYTKEELIDRIEIINPGIDGARIRNELLKTDNNILKYIKSIKVHNSNRVTCSDENAIGCAPQYFIDDKLDYGTIDVVHSKFWTQTNPNGEYFCSSFEYTLNHEIGHIYGGTINIETGSSESFADNYARQHTTAFQRC